MVTGPAGSDPGPEHDVDGEGDRPADGAQHQTGRAAPEPGPDDERKARHQADEESDATPDHEPDHEPDR